MQYARDGAMSALVLGFFASCWFGWAQEKPPPGWRSPLIVGAVLSLIVVAAWVCLVVGVHFWPMSPVLKSPSLVALGALLAGVVVGAVLVSRTTAVATSAITGAGAGLALLGFASWAALSAIA
ncbi:hypothetical protein ACLQ3H_16225 [Micromonospora saelicesensis]|uniref:hypothetical protein n=1 Tax=Micromonospora saelicesensis TaxID=285676 RepID=UPI003CF988D1